MAENPYHHDHNPLNADITGGFCSACEWEKDEQEECGDVHGVYCCNLPKGHEGDHCFRAELGVWPRSLRGITRNLT